MSIDKIIKNGGAAMLACILSAQVFGQGMNDIFRLSSTQIYGSSRLNAMSGAFAALGGDVSAISINPAATAVMRKSSAYFSGGVEFNRNGTSYYGNPTNSNSSMILTVPSWGLNLNFNVYNSPLRGVSIAVNYNRNNNFNNELYYNGNNNTTTDWYRENNSAPWTPIGSSVVESFFRDILGQLNSGVDVNNIGGPPGMAMDLGIIDLNDGTLYNYASYTKPINQKGKIDREGYGGTTSFALGFNIKDKFYVALGLDYVTSRLRKNDIYLDESGFDPIPEDDFGGGLSALKYNRFNTAKADGVAFTLGAIWRPIEPLRLGLSYRTPIRMRVKDDFAYEMTATYFTHKPVSGSSDWLYTDYNYRSPGQVTAGAAYVFGQIGILSVDYDYRNFRNMNFFDQGYGIWIEENQIIEQQMKGVNRVRVGGELRLYPFSLRAGFNYESSPYKDITVEVPDTAPGSWTVVSKPQGVSDAWGFSVGAGVKLGWFNIDAAYMNRRQTRYDYLYYPYLTNPIENKISQNAVSLTIGMSF